MYEENMLLAVNRLRAYKSMPNLSIHFPGETMNNENTLYRCEIIDDSNPEEAYRLAFPVVIEQSDLKLTPQQIDRDAGIEMLPLSDPNPEQLRITMRLAYRIWSGFKSTVRVLASKVNL